MFWRYNPSSTSQVETFLEKETVSLTELLELEDIIQECKNQNKKLVEYLISGDVLSNLIDLIIHEPPEDLEASQRFKLANVAAELLSCEVPQVNEKISGEEPLLDRLYSFIETSDSPLNPLLASFFTKAFGVLITRKTEQNWYSYQCTCVQVFEFLKKKDFVVHVTKHIGTSAISDLVIRLITCIDAKNTKQGILDWLNDKELIESIINLLNDRYDRDVHDNASRLLIEILRVARDGQYMPLSERCDDPLLAKLESPETVELLLNNMFGGTKTDSVDEASEKSVPSQSVLVNGIAILLALLENRKAVNLMDKNGSESAGTLGSNSSGGSALYGSTGSFQAGAGEARGSESSLSAEELAQQQVILDLTIASMIPRFEDFTALLINPPNKDLIKTTAGVLDPPLGQARLQIAKLVSVLLSTNNPNANLKLIELKTLDVLLDLFFQYSLNNFLHAQVESCIQNIFCCANLTTSQENILKKLTEEKVENIEEDETKPQEAEVEKDSTNPDQIVPEAMDESPAEGDKDNSIQPETENPITEKDDVISENNAEIKYLPDPLLVHLYSDCHLVDRVLGAWETNEAEESEPGQKRKGYMGHLTRIANMMHLQQENKTSTSLNVIWTGLQEQTRDKWSSFVSSKLADTNERNTIIPPQSYNNNNNSSSEDDDADFRDINFPQESGIHQIYSDYQMQQMSENINDPYGFTDDEFNDNEESSAKRTLRFGLEDSAVNKESQQELFESFCNARFTSFPGDFDEEKSKDGEQDEETTEDPWENITREIQFGSPKSGKSSSETNLSPIKLSPSKTGKVIRDSNSPSNEDHVACSSSDEEGEKDKADNSMEVEEGKAGDDFWTDEVPPDTTPVDMDTGNPWDSNSAPATTDTVFEAAIEAPAPTSPWAAFDSTAAPEIKANEATWAAFNDPAGVDAKPEAAWAAFNDTEMEPASKAKKPDDEMVANLACEGPQEMVAPVETPAIEPTLAE